MSSILRALKKLENSPRHLDENHPLDTKFVPLADTGQSAKRTGPLVIVIGGGIVCGLVVLAGLLLFADKTKTSDNTQLVAQQELQKPESIPVAQMDSANVQNVASPVETAKPAAERAVPEKTADQVAESTPVEIVQPSVAVIEQRKILSIEKQTAEPTIQRPDSSSHEARDEISAAKIAAVAKVPEPPVKAREKEIPVLNDAGIKLQAITWSKDPQKRIAVIDNRILRQGDVVRGYRIETINQDDVVLNDAGEKWKLLFRIK